MRKQQAERRLAQLGFAIDWPTSGKSPDGFWHGTIDAIGKTSIAGECRGICVSGDDAADFYRRAIDEAEEHRGCLSPCEDPECDFHNPQD